MTYAVEATNHVETTGQNAEHKPPVLYDFTKHLSALRTATNSVCDRPHRVVATNFSDTHLCYLQGIDREEDPRYWMVSNDLTAVLGETGLVESVHAVEEGKRKHIVQRDSAYGNFRTAEGVSLERVLDNVYARINQLTFGKQHAGDAVSDQDMFNWRSQRVLARFGDYQELHSSTDIVPDYSDIMNIVKLSDGCPMACNYCPEGGFIVLYSREQIERNMRSARAMQVKHHGPAIPRMREGFLNTSDINLHYLRQHHDGTDPREIVSMFRETFPEVVKLSTFMATPTTNKAPRSYLKDLQQAGLRKVLVGIESLHDPTSYFLNKRVVGEAKLEAMTKLQDAGFKLEPIFLVGATGKAFKHKGTWHDSREALEHTINKISRIMPRYGRRGFDKIVLSRFQPIEGTPLAVKHKAGEEIIPYNSESELEADILHMEKLARRKRIPVELDYEVALEGRRIA
jgi:radical SAM superfamily enzyme YgiQ (UPF0313 family)